jgi:quinone-modifying oxidoreductase subunit QmoC
MMIPANKRGEVLESSSMWICTSCYTCAACCPRGLSITHIMHGLATYAKRLGLAPKEQPTAKFAQLFWNNLTKTGRVDELNLGLSLYFMNGFSEGVKTSLKMKDIGLGMLKTKGMSPMKYFGGHPCNDAKGIHAILAKAQETEEAKIGKASD